MASSYSTISLLAPVLLFLSGCKGGERVSVLESRTSDTVRLVRLVRDSVFLHDSVFFLRETLHDTVRETRYVYRYHYRDRAAADTSSAVLRTDTLAVRSSPVRQTLAKPAVREKGLLWLKRWLPVTVGAVLLVLLVVRKVKKSWPFS